MTTREQEWSLLIVFSITVSVLSQNIKFFEKLEKFWHCHRSFSNIQNKH